MKKIILSEEKRNNIILNNKKIKNIFNNQTKFRNLNQKEEPNIKTNPSTASYKKMKFNIPKLNPKFLKNYNDYELQKQNENFYKKIFTIQNKNKRQSTNCIFNTHRKDGYIKLNIMNLAQQNLYMLKRLYDQKSQYSAKKLEKEYQKFQSYKKIMSKFPGIDNNKFKSLINDSYFLKSKKSEQSDKSDFLPTINYVKDGSMISIKKHNLKEIKKNDNKIISPKNLKKMFFNENLNKNNSNINNKKEEKIEFEFEFDKHNEDFNKKK